MLRLVVLVSGGGSNLADLLERTRDGRVPATIVAVGADQECGGLELARAAGIATFVEPFAQPRGEWSGRIADHVLAHEPDLTILSGFMRLLSADAVERLSPNLVNTHPAYLPEFPGAHAVRDALAAAGVDTGPVLAQVRVPIHPDDDEASLHDRIKPVERDLLAEVVTNWNQET